MFNIKVNKQILYLGNEFSIPFYVMNSLFSSTNSYTLDFNLPLTDTNRQALQFPDDPHFVFVDYTVPCEICLFDEILFNGTLTIEGTDNSISTFMTIENGNFWELASNIKLPDINWGDAINMGNSTAEVIAYIYDIVNKSMGELDTNNIPIGHNFPMVKAPDFYGDANIAFSGFLNFWDFGNEQIVENIISSSNEDNNNAIVPFFYIVYIFQKIASHFGLDPKGTFFQNNYFRNILLLNNFDLARKEKLYFVRASNSTEQTFPLDSLTHAIQSDDDSTTPNEDLQNIWGLIPSRYIVSNRGFHRFKFKGIVYHDRFAADIRVGVRNVTAGTGIVYADYMIAEDEEFLVNFESSAYIEESNVGDLLEFYIRSIPMVTPGNNIFIKAGSYMVVSNDSYLNLNQFALNISPGNHMPDMPVANFMKSICQYLGLAMFVNDIDSSLYISRIDDIYKDPEIIDITHMVTGNPIVDRLFRNKIYYAASYESKRITFYNYLGQFDTYESIPDPSSGNMLALVKTTGIYYFSTFNETNLKIEWKKYDDKIDPVEIGNMSDELLEFICDVKPAGMDMFSDSIFVPLSQMVATSPCFDTGVNDFDLELIQYHGMKEGPYPGKYYPEASTLRWGKLGANETGFDLTPEYIANNHCKQYFNQMLRANRILNVPIAPTYAEVKSLKPWKKYRIHHLVGLMISVEGQFKPEAPDLCTLYFLPI